MANSSAEVAADNSILCENCGYTLDNLPPGGNCPECGQPIAASTLLDGRSSTAWESGQTGKLNGFLRTSSLAVFRPAYFFRHTTTRNLLLPALRFAQVYWFAAAAMFSLAAWWYECWYAQVLAGWPMLAAWWLLPMTAISFFGLWGITLLASRLTVWEGRYRGYRLPRIAVLRGLYHHAAHYFPVGLMAVLTTGGHLWLVQHHRLGPRMEDMYPWLLSGEVIVAAGYLFWTYWAAMRNMMYANR
jgi:hypothetical protein